MGLVKALQKQFTPCSAMKILFPSGCRDLDAPVVSLSGVPLWFLYTGVTPSCEKLIFPKQMVSDCKILQCLKAKK